MRLRRLDLTAYGKFTGRTIDFGPRPESGPDLHIVYGLNEAGKSTALSGFLDLLFGIEHASRYGFLHPYDAMEVGAALEFDGALHELRRRKRRTGSLVDGAGNAVNEAGLSHALSGLSRETYRTMFSLDDETLEAGGDAILQSRGDLGELLFSASAGLAHIGAFLAKAGEEADAIHRKRGQKTEIAILKHRLADLKKQREALDVGAAFYAGLRETAARAGEAYETTMRERSAVKAALERTERLRRAWPQAEDHARTLAELERYADLPRPPDAWGGELPRLMQDETRIAALIEGLSEREARLGAEIDAIGVDETVLAQAGEIRALGQAVGEYRKAEADLPRRHLALAEHEGALARLLQTLGQAGHRDPAALILPAALTGTLRELIEARSGVEASLRRAERELTDAADAIETLRRDAERETDETPIPPGALPALEATFRRVRESEAASSLRLCERALPEHRRRAEEAMAALPGFTGDASALRALEPADSRRIEAWRGQVATLAQRRETHRARVAEIAARLAALAARRDALQGASGAIDDAEARRLRAARDSAWAHHRSTLDAETADAFAAALGADDTITAARMARVQDLGEIRQLGAALAETEAALAQEQRARDALDEAAEALAAEIRDGAGIDLPTPRADRLALILDRIEAFAARRKAALEAHAALADAEGTARLARAAVARDRAALAEAFARCGRPVGDAPLAELVGLADAWLAGEASDRSARTAAEKALAAAEQALARRRRERAEADTDLRGWETRWTEALAKGWIDRDTPVGAVREILDVLGRLGAVLEQRNEMAHRIETMRADQARLEDALTALLERLGEAPGIEPPPRIVTALLERLEGATSARDDLRRKAGELQAVRDERAKLGETGRRSAARTRELTAFFGVETLGEVAAALERAAERTRLERRRAELAQSLTAQMQTANVEDALAALAALDVEETDRMAADLAARHEDLDARTRSLFAEKTRAADALTAVGGDDAVARLALERQTVLMEVEAAALRYLRLRTGTLLTQEALRTYRDRHRSSMMARASHAFAAMTRGAYAGLSARPEKDRETLIGLARDGGSKLATDMSKGTRFQLYLALRLAGYEEFAAARPPVPFLADDIMETFDEPRSGEVLQLLGQMSGMGQVVYFTHHRHLCDLARQAAPGVRLHEI